MALKGFCTECRQHVNVHLEGKIYMLDPHYNEDKVMCPKSLQTATEVHNEVFAPGQIVKVANYGLYDDWIGYVDVVCNQPTSVEVVFYISPAGAGEAYPERHAFPAENLFLHTV